MNSHQRPARPSEHRQGVNPRSSGLRFDAIEETERRSTALKVQERPRHHGRIRISLPRFNISVICLWVPDSHGVVPYSDFYSKNTKAA